MKDFNTEKVRKFDVILNCFVKFYLHLKNSRSIKYINSRIYIETIRKFILGMHSILHQRKNVGVFLLLSAPIVHVSGFVSIISA